METRRIFLAALGAGVVLAKDAPHRIDVHCHFSPPSYLDAMRASRLLASQTSDWTIAKAIEDMDQAGVATAIVSITTPGVSVLEKDAARRVARECNEYAARLKMDHPGRFGSFIVLPVPDMDGCLKESRIRSGCAQSRRHRPANQLHRQMARRSSVLPAF